MSTFRRRDRCGRPIGFTLVELLVVIMIVILISAVTLPVVLPALMHRQVTESATLLQAGLIGARDAAIRANAPRGIRLLPDPVYPFPAGPSNNIVAANRYLSIETAPDYTEGQIIVFPVPPSPVANIPLPSVPGPPMNSAGTAALFVPYPMGNGVAYPYYTPSSPGSPNVDNPSLGQVLMVEQAPFQGSIAAPANVLPPTSWFWNIRVGDKLRINDSGLPFTVVGPITINPFVATTSPNFGNPELFVNVGLPGNTAGYMTRSYPSASGLVTSPPLEFLFLVNGQDDAALGFVDSGWDGLDNDYDGITDGLSEWQAEVWVGKPFTRGVPQSYAITRRPVPAQGAREVAFPGGTVIDLTGWAGNTISTLPERSRLPVDFASGTVDILIDPSGQVVPTTTYSSPSDFSMFAAFYHFWIAERQDLHGLTETWATNSGTAATGAVFSLPIPQDFTGGLSPQPAVFLKGERALVTLNARTGNVSTKSIETFNAANINFPYVEAQLGVREAK